MTDKVVFLDKRPSGTRTGDLQRFYHLLEQCPRVASYWKSDAAELDMARLESDLELMSAGEGALARFFAGIWLGENRFGFDLMTHLRVLDENGARLVREWINDPFFPLVVVLNLIRVNSEWRRRITGCII